MLDKQLSSEQDGPGDTLHNGKGVQKREKVTFYLTPEQMRRLDDLVYQYNKRTLKRINRNKIVRLLIEHCTVEKLAEIDHE